MTGKQIRVLVVDDSALLREMICDLIAETSDLAVVGTACDGLEALEKHRELQPDVVTLDVQMPRMDGLKTLDSLLKQRPTPIIMVSALTTRSADVTLQALEQGALDYVAKPDHLHSPTTAFRDELLHKLRTMAGADVQRVLRIRRARARRANPVAFRSPGGPTNANNPSPAIYQDGCIAIGISTGGPPALSRLFQSLQPPLPAIVIVQHMPANFTSPFAARLNMISPLSIKEAENGDVLRANQVLIAPGGKHLRLRRSVGTQVVAKISDGEPVSGHKPSVDVMLQTAASLFGERCLGLIMTGMGFDGAKGCAAIQAAGGFVLGQDEASSDVYGMNKVAFQNGHVHRQVALEELPSTISLQCRRMLRLINAS